MSQCRYKESAIYFRWVYLPHEKYRKNPKMPKISKNTGKHGKILKKVAIWFPKMWQKNLLFGIFCEQFTFVALCGGFGGFDLDFWGLSEIATKSWVD